MSTVLQCSIRSVYEIRDISDTMQIQWSRIQYHCDPCEPRNLRYWTQYHSVNFMGQVLLLKLTSFESKKLSTYVSIFSLLIIYTKSTRLIFLKPDFQCSPIIIKYPTAFKFGFLLHLLLSLFDCFCSDDRFCVYFFRIVYS